MPYSLDLDRPRSYGRGGMGNIHRPSEDKVVAVMSSSNPENESEAGEDGSAGTRRRSSSLLSRHSSSTLSRYSSTSTSRRGSVMSRIFNRSSSKPDDDTTAVAAVGDAESENRAASTSAAAGGVERETADESARTALSSLTES